jgi:hypothetical protein
MLFIAKQKKNKSDKERKIRRWKRDTQTITN